VGTEYGSHYWRYLNRVRHETETFQEQKGGMLESAVEMRGTRTLDTHKYAYIKPLNAKLNPICHLLTLLGAHHILHFSRIRVKLRRITNLVLEEKDEISADSHSVINRWTNHF
jgi:hypothetical protein